MDDGDGDRWSESVVVIMPYNMCMWKRPNLFPWAA